MSNTLKMAFIVACVAFALMRVLAGCTTFGPADRAAISDTTNALEQCQEVGRACQGDGGKDCYSAYEACTVDAGLR